MIELFLISKLTEIFGICVMHLVWSKSLGFYEPLPFRQALSCYLVFPVSYTRIWYLIPKETRMDPDLRKRCKALFCVLIWLFCQCAQFLIFYVPLIILLLLLLDSCCFIPFCLRELKAAHHFCPKCQVYIGSY